MAQTALHGPCSALTPNVKQRNAVFDAHLWGASPEKAMAGTRAGRAPSVSGLPFPTYGRGDGVLKCGRGGSGAVPDGL